MASLNPDAVTPIDVDSLENWYQIVDLVATLAGVPAALIRRVDGPDLVNVAVSRGNGRTPAVGARQPYRDSGMYCEQVINRREELLIPNAAADEAWAHSPGARNGWMAYLGLPILQPDGEVFGTICVLDASPRQFTRPIRRLLFHFKRLVEGELNLIAARREITTLRGLIPICGFCKRVRDDGGFWHGVEQYVEAHSEADFTHGVCPTCAADHYGYTQPEPGSPETTRIAS